MGKLNLSPVPPFFRLWLCLVLLGQFGAALGQSGPGGGAGDALTDKINRYNTAFPVEKLHLQTDKKDYFVNDTLWFKAYLLDHNLAYSALSSRIYVDILNDSSKIVKSMVIPVVSGLSWGEIDLSDQSFRDGNYILRAYTNWMRNFGSDYISVQPFHVTSPAEVPWLVKVNSTTAPAGKDISLNTTLQFSALNGIPAAGRDVAIKVTSTRGTLLSHNFKTSPGGSVSLAVQLPDGRGDRHLAVRAGDPADKTRQEYIPLFPGMHEDFDAQFLPESGYLVDGIPTTIGFKAVDENGEGLDVSGEVIDSHHNELAKFKSLHRGLGKFDFVPQYGEVYTAIVTAAGGHTKKILLPATQQAGTVLKITNDNNGDSLVIVIMASPNLVSTGKNYALVGQVRNKLFYASQISLTSQISRVKIAKRLFPTGIVHFTLFNPESSPLNERLTFINHRDEMRIDLRTDKNSYSPHDSIPLHITVRDVTGKPIQGSFSVAVTDNAQVKSSSGNILTDMLLTSELKGTVDDPEFFLGGDSAAWKALDVLLLTQGWTGYHWNEILKPDAAPVFRPEKEYTVTGRVTNLTNRPVSGAHVYLVSTGKQRLFKDTVTAGDGSFTFRNFPPTDSTAFVLSAKNSKGKTIRAGISVDLTKPVPGLTGAGQVIDRCPWYVIYDGPESGNPADSDQSFKRTAGLTGRLLQTVNIKSQGTVRGSKNVNGSGNADQVITQSEIEKTGPISLYDLLKQKITNFNIAIDKKSNSDFVIKEKKLRFIIDGIDLDRFYQQSDSPVPNEHFDYIRQYLESISAEDVKGVEMSYSMKYNMNYDANYLADNPVPVASDKFAYIEVTTRSGNGPFMDKATGVFIYKPVPVVQPKTFYSPRYVSRQSGTVADTRSTIFWMPFVVTSKSGQADVYFYAADRASAYTVRLEGVDLKGKVGYQGLKINVK